MRSDGTRRRSLLSNLFAERQVYMRSGPHSQYVVLSRPLQIGVALGFVAILALLAVVSYVAIARHFEVAAQRQALVDLEAAARENRSAASLDGLRERSAAAEAEVLRLRAALDDARAERQTAGSATADAADQIAALNARLDEAQTALRAARSDAATRVRELQAALAAATTESRDLATELQEIRASGQVRNATLSTRLAAALTQATGLRAELDRVNREVAALRSTAQAQAALHPENRGTTPPATSPPDAPPMRLDVADEVAAAQVLQLKEQLAGAQATIDALTADLAAAKGVPTNETAAGTVVNVAADPAQGDPPLPSPPAPR